MKIGWVVQRPQEKVIFGDSSRKMANKIQLPYLWRNMGLQILVQKGIRGECMGMRYDLFERIYCVFSIGCCLQHIDRMIF